MPVVDMLVDAAAGHKVISFKDGNAGYNQIFMVEEDIRLHSGAQGTLVCSSGLS